MAYGRCLAHTFCPRGACQQAGTASGMTVSGLRRGGAPTSTRRVNAVANADGGPATTRAPVATSMLRRYCVKGCVKTACGCRDRVDAWPGNHMSVGTMRWYDMVVRYDGTSGGVACCICNGVSVGPGKGVVVRLYGGTTGRPEYGAVVRLGVRQGGGGRVWPGVTCL